MSFSFKIKVLINNNTCRDCPVFYILPKKASVLNGEPIEGLYMTDHNGHQVPLQWRDCGDTYKIYWILKSLPSQSTVEYVISSEGEERSDPGIEFVKKDKKIDVSINGEYFTSYVYGPTIAKPYLGPIINPYGDSYTRLDFDTKEHPHHRSLWVAIGDVNGIDTWNEPEGKYGKEIHKGFAKLEVGPVFGRIIADNVWTKYNEDPLIDERRIITLYNTSAQGRFIDLEVIFKASYGQVEFGPTKEAGPLGIRVAESMKVDNGGTMVNSNGGASEKECWGHRARWCDYNGMVEGKRGGIAVFDNPNNEGYPTHWHIRNYGLLAPNNFYFTGSKTLQPEEIMKYNYRIYFHSGDTATANVEGCYQDYISPPLLEPEGV